LFVAVAVVAAVCPCRYGAVFTSHLFGAPTVVSCDPELNHLVLQGEERLFRCSYPGTIRGILGGSSLLVVTGERHRRIRALAVSLAASAGLRPGYLAGVDRAARAAVASWRGRRTVSFCAEAQQVTSRALAVVRSPSCMRSCVSEGPAHG
jgi:cytochrome P450 family 724 subfamily B polypeptide 1